MCSFIKHVANREENGKVKKKRSVEEEDLQTYQGILKMLETRDVPEISNIRILSL